MHLAIITDAWTPQINGVVTTLLRIVEDIRSQGHLVTIIHPGLFRSIPLPGYGEIPLVWEPWMVWKMLNGLDVDSVHIATEGPLGIVAKIWADRSRRCYTTSYHTKFPEYIAERLPGTLGLGYCYMRWFHRRSSNILVNTETMMRDLADHGLSGLTLWGRGVDTTRFHPDGPVPALYDSLPRPILLNVGRVAIEKNLSAFYGLETAGTKVQVGGGPEMSSLIKRFPDVHFVGPRHGDDLASYYRGANVFVFPSKTDTYGLVMLEAIASGLPVAAYPVPGPMDVVEDGVTGALGQLDDAVERALHLASLEQTKAVLMDAARAQSWEISVAQFLSALCCVRTGAVLLRY